MYSTAIDKQAFLPDKEGRTILGELCQAKRFEASSVEAATRAPPDSAGGEPSIVLALLRHKADPNALCMLRDPESGAAVKSWVPLACEAAYGQAQLVGHLLDNGADINAKRNHDSKGGAPRSEPRYTGVTALMVAIKPGHTDVVSRLLIRRADTGSVDEYGDSALITAAKYDRRAIVKELTKYDAGRACLNYACLTALTLACELGHCDVVALLHPFGEEGRVCKRGRDMMAHAHNNLQTSMIVMLHMLGETGRASHSKLHVQKDFSPERKLGTGTAFFSA